MKVYRMLLFASILVVAMTACNNEKKNENENENPEEPTNTSTQEELDYVQVVSGTENGHDYVDLGLPSGLLWATCNVGAAKPTDRGDYFRWGETTPTILGNTLVESYKWCTWTGGEVLITKYNWDAEYGHNGFVDNKMQLDSEDDAAHVNWKTSWRMATKEEWSELQEQCTFELVNRLVDYGEEIGYYYSGTKFRDADDEHIVSFSILIKATGPNGNSIVFPLGHRLYFGGETYDEFNDYAARYMSSSLNSYATPLCNDDFYLSTGINNETTPPHIWFEAHISEYETYCTRWEPQYVRPVFKR